MANQNEKAEKFKALHEREGAFVIPNPWDAGSARLLAALGFEALATTSAGFAFSLGRLDGEVSRAEAIEHCRALCASTELPVSADLENCFADDPVAAAETIKLAARAGLVGCSIEDYSGHPAQPIYDFSLAVERVSAAAEAARSLDSPSRSRLAPRTCCAAETISTTRSAACARSKPRARTCSTRRDSGRSKKSAAWRVRSASL